MTRIIGDTSSGLSVEQAKNLDIDYLPQFVFFDDIAYRDDFEIDSETYVKKLQASKVLPKTSAPPPDLYASIFEKMRENNEGAVIICPSQHLSGTFRSAMTAKNEFPDLDIRVIDTGLVGPTVAVSLLEAKKMANDGKTIDEIEDFVNLIMKNGKLFAVVDTLEYLYKGGRIGGASKLFGDALHIKPILTVRGGKTEIYEKQRTSKKAYARMIDIVESDYSKDYKFFQLAMAVNINIHGDDLEIFKQEFKNRLGISEFPVFDVPPAFMVHAGPGLVLVSYFTI